MKLAKNSPIWSYLILFIGVIVSTFWIFQSFSNIPESTGENYISTAFQIGVFIGIAGNMFSLFFVMASFRKNFVNLNSSVQEKKEYKQSVKDYIENDFSRRYQILMFLLIFLIVPLFTVDVRNHSMRNYSYFYIQYSSLILVTTIILSLNSWLGKVLLYKYNRKRINSVIIFAYYWIQFIFIYNVTSSLKSNLLIMYLVLVVFVLINLCIIIIGYRTNYSFIFPKRSIAIPSVVYLEDKSKEVNFFSIEDEKNFVLLQEKGNIIFEGDENYIVFENQKALIKSNQIDEKNIYNSFVQLRNKFLE